MIKIAAPDLTHCGHKLRQVILEDYKKDIPITGGWGYSKEDAIVIAPIKDFVSLEYFIVEKRIYEELIVFRDKNDSYSGIRWKLLNQQLVSDDTGTYDVLRFDVTAHKKADWEALKEEFESNNGFADNEELRKQHFAKNESLLNHYQTEFWFNITECRKLQYQSQSSNPETEKEVSIAKRNIQKPPSDDDSRMPCITPSLFKKNKEDKPLPVRQAEEVAEYKNIDTIELHIMVFMPVIFFFIGIAMALMKVNPKSGMCFYIIVWLVLWWRDISRLKKAGVYTDSWKYMGLLGIFIPPLYFWQRKKHTQSNGNYLFISIVIFVIFFLLNIFFK